MYYGRKQVKIETIVLSVLLGSDLSNVIRESYLIANKNGCEVQFKFNDVNFEIAQGSLEDMDKIVKDLSEKYSKILDYKKLVTNKE